MKLACGFLRISSVIIILLEHSCALEYSQPHRGTLPDGRIFNHDARVIGGSDASQGQYPFAVFLEIEGSGNTVSYCGGSIITDQWVLTAGHCVVNTEQMGNKLTLVNGTVSSTNIRRRSSSSSSSSARVAYPMVSPKSISVGVGNVRSSRAQVYKVTEIHTHPDLNLEYFDNDIALIKLDRKLAFNSNVQPVRIDAQDVPDGLTVTGVGWGLTTLGSSHVASRLQQVDLKTGNEGMCKQIRSEFDNNNGNYICVTTPNGKDTCSGDSGGPLVRRCNSNPNDTGSGGSGGWLLLGVTSYGDNVEHSDSTVCADSDGAGFYSHASKYLDFISKTTQTAKSDLSGDCNGNNIQYGGNISDATSIAFFTYISSIIIAASVSSLAI